MGFFNIVMFLLPPSFHWLTSSLGFSSSKEIGLARLEDCWKSGCMRSLSAAMILHWVYFVILKEEEKSSQIIKELSLVYPGSTLVWLSFARRNILQGKMEEARHALAQAQPFANEIGFTQVACDYFKGET